MQSSFYTLLHIISFYTLLHIISLRVWLPDRDGYQYQVTQHIKRRSRLVTKALSVPVIA